MLQPITRTLLRGLSRDAAKSDRLRRNHNLHQSYEEPCQRLLNALEPGTYIRPHRHLTPPKPECFVALAGRMAAVTFGDQGELERVLVIGPQDETLGLDIPAGTWHAVVALSPGSAFFETKPGPYEPLSDKDWAPWAPEEGSFAAPAYLADLERRVRVALGEGLG